MRPSASPTITRIGAEVPESDSSWFRRNHQMADPDIATIVRSMMLIRRTECQINGLPHRQQRRASHGSLLREARERCETGWWDRGTIRPRGGGRGWGRDGAAREFPIR